MGARAKQALTLVVGGVVAAVMLILGLWQMASYEASTRDVSAERAAQPVVQLVDAVAADGTVSDVYGRRVEVEGSYLPQYEALIGTDGPWRVATLLELPDGRHVAVVRGALEPGAEIPAAPHGEQHIEGIFLASDKSASPDGPQVADLPSLRLQELAQRWPSPLIAGYVTLPADASRAQGLAEAPLELPEAEGSPTHRGYALQWWVFAAAAVGFSIYVARGFAPAPNPDSEGRDAQVPASGDDAAAAR